MIVLEHPADQKTNFVADRLKDPYPFCKSENPEVVRRSVLHLVDAVVDRLDLRDSQKRATSGRLHTFIQFHETRFLQEEQGRLQTPPVEGCNTGWHDRNHMYQALYDLCNILAPTMEYMIEIKKPVSNEGALGMVTGETAHDDAYHANPDGQPVLDHAKQLDTHVDKSEQLYVAETPDLLFPDYQSWVDMGKPELGYILQAGRYTIHATNFCFKPDQIVRIEGERAAQYSRMPENLQREAPLYAALGRYADLAQCATRDYMRCLEYLFDEFEAAEPGKGLREIGLPHERLEKTRGFMRFVRPKVLEPLEIALFGTTDTIYTRRMLAHIGMTYEQFYAPDYSSN
jgi:hypothetical protein